MSRGGRRSDDLSPVRTVNPDTPAREAIRIMRDHKFGCLPVVKDNGQLVGIFIEADLVRFADKGDRRGGPRAAGDEYRA